jgi:uncharacterized membrane protein
MNFNDVILFLARAVEMVGIVAILVGAVVASARFLRQWVRGRIGGAFTVYRVDLGRAMLLGLEFLIIAEIVRTVAMVPTFTDLGILGGIVLIRIFLTIMLEVEISGTLPWRRASAATAGQPHPEFPDRARGTATEQPWGDNRPTP